mgnify:FL=1|jgi:hypothetical protein
MRRFYNNGTSFVEALTKGTPIGAVGSIVKKIKKSKEDKESRNPNPKTPKMMGTDEDLTKEEKKFKLQREFKDERRINKNYKKKFEKPLGKMKPEVQPARKLED